MMFICDDCPIISICKIYEGIKDYKEIISIKECGAKNLIQNKIPVVEENVIHESNMEERINTLKELIHSEEKEISYIRKSEDNVCESCKKENTDLLICSICESKICPDCAIEDFSDTVYCPECYEEKTGDII